MKEMPLMELRSSSHRVVILGDRIERRAAGLRRLRTEAIRHEQLHAVRVMRGILFSKMRFESKDGRVIEIAGINKRRAEEGQTLLVGLTAAVRQSTSDQTPDTADQIRKLGALRDDELLTEKEFNDKKRQLLWLE